MQESENESGEVEGIKVEEIIDNSLLGRARTARRTRKTKYAFHYFDQSVESATDEFKRYLMNAKADPAAAAAYIAGLGQAVRNREREIDFVMVPEKDTVVTTIDVRKEQVAYTPSEQLMYASRRRIQITAGYAAVGMKPFGDEIDQFGSLQEVSARISACRDKWGDTNIAKWLLSLTRCDSQWGGHRTPYSRLLDLLPAKIPELVLDYGCGSGHGAEQLRAYYGLSDSQVHVYDCDDNRASDRRNMKFVDRVEGIYDLVVISNVLHHDENSSYIIQRAMKAVRAGGTLVIKEHSYCDETAVLVSLVHDMYSHGDIQTLYLRSHAVVRRAIADAGWDVVEKILPKNDLFDVVLICTSHKTDRLVRMKRLDEDVVSLKTEVLELRELVSELSLELSAMRLGVPQEKQSRKVALTRSRSSGDKERTSVPKKKMKVSERRERRPQENVKKGHVKESGEPDDAGEGLMSRNYLRKNTLVKVDNSMKGILVPPGTKAVATDFGKKLIVPVRIDPLTSLPIVVQQAELDRATHYARHEFTRGNILVRFYLDPISVHSHGRGSYGRKKKREWAVKKDVND